MKKILLVLLSLSWCITLIAQDTGINSQMDISPNPSHSVYVPNQEALWDLLLEFDAAALSGAAGNAGAEWDGTSFYSTRWASNLIHEYSADGTTLIREFSIPGVSGLRDLAYDGTYFYGGAASTTIYQMDFSTNTLIGTIPTTEAVRHIAYDSDLDAFWVGNWSTDIVCIDRAGTELHRIPADPVVTSNYGSCYDNVSPGGPFLWVFSQGAGAGSPQYIHQLQLPGGAATGVAHDVLSDITGASGSLSIAGGLFSMTDYAPGFFTIGGLLQGNPIGDIIFVYDSTAGCSVGQATDPNPVNGATDVDINLAAISWTNGTGTAPTEIEVWFDGAVVYTGPPNTSYTIPAPLAYSTTYEWKVNGSNGLCWTNGPTWTFTTMGDPSITGTWSSGTVMPGTQYVGSGVALNGYVYSVGGNTTSGLNTECYKYEVATDTWTQIASLPVGKVTGATATDGVYLYAIGGSSAASGAYTDTCYQYNVALDTWTQVASLPAAIGWPQAVGYNGTHIYVAGGHDGVNPLATVYVYDVALDSWSAATSMPGERFGGAFSVTGNQLVYVSGIDLVTFTDAVYVGTIDGVDPTLITWVTAAKTYPGKVKGLTSRDSNVNPTDLIVGEKDKNYITPEAVYPPGGTYKFAAAGPWGTDGIIVAGGNDGVGGFWTATDHCYVYNPTTDTWSAELPMPIGVLQGAGGTVNSGDIWKFVVASGYTGSSITDATQIYTDDLGGGTTFAYQVTVADGWNMVSVPGTNPAGMAPVDWWSNLVGNVFKFSGGYVAVTTTAPTEGYWMKNNGAETYSYPATGIVAHNSINAAAGWNLIGGYELTVLTALLTTTPPGLLQLPIYEYSGGYIVATSIVPGYGYWAKMSAAGLIDAPPLAKGSVDVVEYFKEDWGKIILTDATGINYTLYAVTGEVNLDNYELPPAPPTGMFDIRFSSGRIAEDINSSIQSIDMSGVTYPLTVRVEGMDIRLQDETGRTVNVNLKSGEDVVISDATIQKLMVTGELVPAVYALEQNYPNPFNPSTTIEFSLPEDVSNVKLSIYNALGERVAEIVNTSLVAGKYQYQWNAKNVATGMYIYELRTDKFVSVKKMILMK